MEHIWNNTRSKLFARDTRVQIYRRPVVPVITSFSVTPTNIDLDDRLTGTISFSLVLQELQVKLQQPELLELEITHRLERHLLEDQG